MIQFINSVFHLFGQFGYGGIIFLMALESSIIPVPSELIIPPAAVLASRGGLNLFLVIIAGVVGSVVGAVISYFIAYFLGRAIVYRLADHRISKTILINSAKVKKAEDFFLKYGSASVFFGRLLPVVRHLISLPAGFCKMNFGKFILYTTLGSTIWVSILAIAGYYLGLKIEIIAENFRSIMEILITIVVVILLVYFFRKKNKKI